MSNNNKPSSRFDNHSDPSRESLNYSQTKIFDAPLSSTKNRTEQKQLIDEERPSQNPDTLPRMTRREKFHQDKQPIWAEFKKKLSNSRLKMKREPHQAQSSKPKTQRRVEKEQRSSQPEHDQSQNSRKIMTQKQAAYSLDSYSTKEKIRMGANIAMRVIGKLVIFLVVLMLLGGALVGGIGIGYFADLVKNTPPPTKEEMAQQIYQLDQQSSLYYNNGEPIAKVRADIVRTVTDLSNISSYIIDGFIATEDEHFAEHPGVVPKAIIRATLENLIFGSGTGGSTLTQQLVKQQMLTDDVTFFRKANEILLALRLENYFSKEEILTAYLNVASFGRNNSGDNIAGIGQAAVGIFGVSPSSVSLPQAAFIAGLPQDPYNYTPYDQAGQLRENLDAGIRRMQEVLFRMYRTQKISKSQYEEAMAYDITKDFLDPAPRQEERQSYLYNTIMNGAIEKLMLLNIENDNLNWRDVYSDVDWYNEYYFAAEEQLRTGGYKVYSTIDRQIYDQLQISAQEYNDEIGVTYEGIYTDPETGIDTHYVESVQTGMVVIENQTGRVLGFVAGTDFENNQIDHAFGMRRSPGSTIKPLAVYGPAIENNLITPATMIPDTPFIEEYGDGSTWQPTNYGNAISYTNISVRRALLRSDNIPAIRIYQAMVERGVPIIDYLSKMGFNTVDSYTYEDTQNLAFSIGGVTTGPTVFEETRAFTTFANNGNYIEGYYIERIEDSFGNIVFQQDKEPVRVFNEDTNYLMVDMMRDTLTQGTGRTANENLAFSADWIMKTGISEHSKDIWVLGSTPSITIGSWIGYDSRYHDYTIDVNDGYGLESVRSQIYWARIVNDLYNLRPDIFGTERVFTQPSSVIEQQIVETTGTLPGTTIVNGQTYSITSPLVAELFKVSNPASPLTSNFLFGASADEQLMFWTGHMSLEAIREQQRREQENEETTQDPDSDSDDGNSPEETTSATWEEVTQN